MIGHENAGVKKLGVIKEHSALDHTPYSILSAPDIPVKNGYTAEISLARLGVGLEKEGAVAVCR